MCMSNQVASKMRVGTSKRENLIVSDLGDTRLLNTLVHSLGRGVRNRLGCIRDEVSLKAVLLAIDSGRSDAVVVG